MQPSAYHETLIYEQEDSVFLTLGNFKVYVAIWYFV